MDILDIAKRECKGLATQEEVALLNRPEMYGKWVNALTAALNELDSQMTYHRDRINLLSKDASSNLISAENYEDEKSRFDSWQRKALRYKSGIQKRLTEVKLMMLENGNTTNQASILAEAIMRHKNQTAKSGLTPEKHDLELWATLGNI